MKRLLTMMMCVVTAAYCLARGLEGVRAAGRSPAVGNSLALVAALDQSGTRRSLTTVLGREGALVTFLRSAEWCPSCKVQLVEFEAVRGRLAGAGYGLAAVTIDEVPVLARFASERQIGFPMLSGRGVISSLGMIDHRFDADPQRKGAPHPAVYVVNRTMLIERIFPESERQTVASMLAHLRVAARDPVARHETPHLSTATWASDPAVDTNRRFSLVVDVSPKPSMHLYAPGDHKYKTVKLTLDSLDGLSAEPLEFPKSQPYIFKALGETVPVYGKPFRLVQDVMIARAPDGSTSAALRSLLITGRLEYQACDDVVCYPAATVPLAWKVQVK